MTARRLGVVAALIAFAIDQAAKAWLMYGFDIAAQGPVEIVPFLDVRLAWNTGISYSLFHGEGDIGRYGLLAVSLVACVLLGLWLWRTRRAITAVALGLLVGGALSNALDRWVHGAVADFIHVHWGNFSPWGVFNPADVAIVAGVGLLLYDAFLLRDAGSAESRPGSGGDAASKLP
jgi:signal peptidase II